MQAGKKSFTMTELRKFLERPRPRLFLPAAGAGALAKQTRGKLGAAIAGKIRADALRILRYPPLERIVTGRRLLDVSRNALYRLNTLGVAWLLDGDRRFAERARKELLNICAFSDWHPDHFLDTAEMTLAAALAYDWLYPGLDDRDRGLCTRAIVEKGLLPSLSPYHWWITGYNNWTQVCHAGMVAGALAVADRFPDFALPFLNRAAKNLPRVMRLSYAANGAYPEGTMYWGYGTEFNLVLILLLQRAMGRDGGLYAMPGFADTGRFMAAATGTSGLMFCHSDSHPEPLPGFATLALAALRGAAAAPAPAALAVLNRELVTRPRGEALVRDRNFGGDRLLPLALFAVPDLPEKGAAPQPLFTSGAGAEVPIVILREPACGGDAWAGLKGGRPSCSHGHMDAGSFILDAFGLRWTEDLGMQPYHEIEETGMNLWDSAPGADRWKIFRIGAESHNILRLGEPGEQDVRGAARLVGCARGRAEFALESLYPGLVSAARRSFTLDAAGFTVTDRLRGLRPGTKTVFQFCTRAAVGKITATGCELRQGKRRLPVEFSLPVRITVRECDDLARSYDAPNPGRRMVRAETAAPAGAMTLETRFRF